MATELVEGMIFRTPAAVAVDDALIGAFADVIGSAGDAIPIGVIFRVSVELAHQAMDSGVVPRDGIVHTAESLRVRRAPVRGDLLSGVLTVTHVRHRAGATQLAVRSDIHADGETEPIAASTSTLVFRSEGAADE
ncbi:hypothetical protein GIY30_12065 [Gordonia sp. HNM0687]|uniref:N-terminal of MaoC-like dehydratase domain-containing protein n=1 Tax=Gordonia mangrovi TaxID=2665643 RepID=A0A6L7GQA0_9ACTN|nr:hypothetical protein [Gordonia mangrovi]MDY6807709.1 hypothetical protein [Actinomycetota bacterium]MXP22080.1 hypothetical protein [Gordonia mangrovi]UVF77997.1 hypothetical protein NWF22_22675 [Gordonia mangrovi]